MWGSNAEQPHRLALVLKLNGHQQQISMSAVRVQDNGQWHCSRSPPHVDALMLSLVMLLTAAGSAAAAVSS